MSVSAAVDPEEAFVASPLQLPHAVVPVHRRRAGFVVDSYREEAVGMIAKDTFGKLAMTSVTLRPESLFGGNHRPTADDVGPCTARRMNIASSPARLRPMSDANRLASPPDS